MNVSRGALVHVGVRAAGLALVGSATLTANILLFDWPPLSPAAGLAAGLFVGVFALAPLVVERVARRWGPSWRRDLLAAALAWVACAAWGVPSMLQQAHARAVADGRSLDGAQAMALDQGASMLARPIETLSLLACVSAVFFPATVVALRPGVLAADMLGAALAAVALGAVALVPGGFWAYPPDVQVFLVLVGAAALASPPLHRLGDLAERRVNVGAA